MKGIGLDIGSTTIKAVVTDESGEILFSSYHRHKSNIKEKLVETLLDVDARFPDSEFFISFAGSSALSLSRKLGVPFVQEVFALQKAAERLAPETDVVIELGGEDAKILFMPPSNEFRMNGSCAGGTGAFIDQMAQLLGTDAAGLDKLSEDSLRTYQIASRCGVFAKSDIQPLLNQGASKPDVAASVFYAVVNQTVSGLAQGRKIEGNVLYAGGPLHFLKGLRNAFDDVLGIKGKSPDNSLFYVALGAVFANRDRTARRITDLVQAISSSLSLSPVKVLAPLFSSFEEYEDFRRLHDADNNCIRFSDDRGLVEGFLGIDAGSTTIKAVLIGSDKSIADSMYAPANGDSLEILVDYIKSLYDKYPNLRIVSSAVTGYGEDMIRSAFRVDNGLVETMAHFIAARHFREDVSFIIDIGGQDIKCFLIRNGAIDSLFLNEACSSGCGSFLSSFASLCGYSPEEFSSLAIRSSSPADLGSRCTVFMNSSVKQAQKDGASIEDIAAGLSVSVVKNALYKVIRTSVKKMGDSIVVQGGTFLSDAVLRSFEMEVGKKCVRPKIAGLMGAFGCALYALEKRKSETEFISRDGIREFSYSKTLSVCGGCENHCRLNIIAFKNGSRHISGNKCQKPLGVTSSDAGSLFAFKRALLKPYQMAAPISGKMVIGLPLCLNMYEFLPFWYTLFSELGFSPIVSCPGSRSLYLQSQHTLASDTVCYPAKLAHGCVMDLENRGADIIFYPNMTYNTSEGGSDNHYNCPVVAYYPQVLGMNFDFHRARFFSPFVNLDERDGFAKRFRKSLVDAGLKVRLKGLKAAVKKAFSAYDEHMRKICAKSQEIIDGAKRDGVPLIVLASRPYHIDEEICHGIDKLITSLGAYVVTEDGIGMRRSEHDLSVLNQWTYHARLYNAAEFVANETGGETNFVQLVSFGCGIDAITQDECRKIIERSGKIYTSIKIDEIANLGAARIRLRSLFAASAMR